MKGYKAFYFDLTCRPTDASTFRYEIGVTYRVDGAPIICQRGLHFCPVLADVYMYYPSRFDIRVCEVEALGNCDWGPLASWARRDLPAKAATNKLHIIRELEPADIRRALPDVRTDAVYKKLWTLPSIRRSIRVFNNMPSVYFLWEDDRGFSRYPKDDSEIQWLKQRAQLWADVLSDIKANNNEMEEKKE